MGRRGADGHVRPSFASRRAVGLGGLMRAFCLQWRQVVLTLSRFLSFQRVRLALAVGFKRPREMDTPVLFPVAFIANRELWQHAAHLI